MCIFEKVEFRWKLAQNLTKIWRLWKYIFSVLVSYLFGSNQIRFWAKSNPLKTYWQIGERRKKKRQIFDQIGDLRHKIVDLWLAESFVIVNNLTGKWRKLHNLTNFYNVSKKRYNPLYAHWLTIIKYLPILETVVIFFFQRLSIFLCYNLNLDGVSFWV